MKNNKIPKHYIKRFMAMAVTGSYLFTMTLATGCGLNNKSTESETVPEHVLVYAENQADDYPATLGAYRLAQLVEERTNGRIKIVVRSNGEMGDETSIVEQIQFGGVDIARVSLSPLAEYIPELNVLQMPYLYSNQETMWKALDGEIGQRFKDAIQQKGNGLRVLSWYDAGSRNFYASRPIQTLADLKGMNIRVQESELMVEMIRILGANLVKMIYSDVYQGLQTGKIDAAENNWPSYQYAKHSEVAPFCLVDEHTRIPEAQIISEGAWNQLGEEDQAIVSQCAVESANYEKELWRQSEEDARDDAIKKGATLTYISKKDLQEFQTAVQPLYDRYCADYMDIIQEIRSMN